MLKFKFTLVTFLIGIFKIYQQQQHYTLYVRVYHLSITQALKFIFLIIIATEL